MLNIQELKKRETFKDLREVFKLKKDTPEYEDYKPFLNYLSSYEVVPTIDSKVLLESRENVVFVDYLYSSIKRRAQTIGTAYRIAMQIMTLLKLNRRDLITNFIKSMEYTNNPSYLDDVYDKPGTDFVVSSHNNALFTLDNLPTKHDDLTEEDVYGIVAGISVTFAWVETYYLTSFMPQDLEIIKTSSDVHQMLKNEVTHLISKSKNYFKHIIGKNPNKIRVNSRFYNSERGIVMTIPLLLDKTLVEFRTSQTPPKESGLYKDVSNSVAAIAIDRDPVTRAEPYGLLDILVYYPRHDKLIELGVVQQTQEESDDDIV